MRITLSIIPLAALLLSTAMPGFAQDKAPALIGEFVLPTGLKLNGLEFGGISGLDYDPAQNVYYVIETCKSYLAMRQLGRLEMRQSRFSTHWSMSTLGARMQLCSA
ncbi:hypothetical protein [Ochrobactrum sp. AN78]|uniref:hypothetical protein n=1 Tax=Ochrobactrum sp. AN78 TaxID=3039853 RepID=UPI003999E3BF